MMRASVETQLLISHFTTCFAFSSQDNVKSKMKVKRTPSFVKPPTPKQALVNQHLGPDLHMVRNPPPQKPPPPTTGRGTPKGRGAPINRPGRGRGPIGPLGTPTGMRTPTGRGGRIGPRGMIRGGGRGYPGRGRGRMNPGTPVTPGRGKPPPPKKKKVPPTSAPIVTSTVESESEEDEDDEEEVSVGEEVGYCVTKRRLTK